jgi:sugar phosphate isomerase/epimerase
MSTKTFDRRHLLHLGACGLAGLGAAGLANAARQKPTAKGSPVDRGKPTKFQIACMTLPYSAFPLERALTGLQKAGYRYVAWGTAHREDGGKPQPVVANDAPPERARELGKRCRDMGLEPVMMFGPSPEKVEELKHRVLQAQAAGVGQVLTMGSSRGNDAKLWVRNFKMLGPVAHDHGVLIVVKQHGGNTGTGAGLAEIVGEAAQEGVKVSYDAGNVVDYYKGKINPLTDIEKCATLVRSFCIKDHRFFPKDEDCGPGLGEIDHYRLLAPVAFTGYTMPLCCENIFAPGLPRPSKPEGIDALARRARGFLKLVIEGLQA